MDKRALWAPQLNISELQIQEWIQQTPEGACLAAWCLEHQLISEPKYLEWAQEFYQIPSLKTDYFQKDPPFDLMNHHQDQFWPEHAVPIAEWEGVLYVACVEPQHSFQIEKPIQWILAPFAEIRRWKQMARFESPPPPDESIHPLANIDFSSARPPAPGEPPPLPFVGDPSKEATPLRPKNAAPSHLPETTKNIETTFSAPTPTPMATVEAAPTPPPPPPPEDDFLKDIYPSVVSTEVISAPPAPEPEVEIEVAAEKERVQDAQSSKTAVTDLGVIDVPKAPTIDNPRAVTSADDLAVYVLSRMRQTFEKTMILRFVNGTLHPWKWDEQWQKDAQEKPSIELKSASIFKIVADTQFPFHGYVVPNPINDRFFRIWNQGLIPEHVTIWPIKSDADLLGMILGISSRAKASTIRLDSIEILSEEIVRLMTKFARL